MNALLQLERAGYEFKLTSEGAIVYAYRSAGVPDGSWARPLLAEVQQRRTEVAALLEARKVRQKAGETFTNKTRCHVIFQADTRLPFPAGSWRRLNDGRIEAYLNYDELQVMRVFHNEVPL